MTYSARQAGGVGRVKIGELFFVGHGSRELSYEMPDRISRYTPQLLQAQLLVMEKCVTAQPSCRSSSTILKKPRILEFDVVHISYTHHTSSWVYSKQQSQSTSIPFPFNSFLAISISPINSLYASGTSLNVNTPQPNLNSRYAPKETRAQKGNCWCAELAGRSSY